MGIRLSPSRKRSLSRGQIKHGGPMQWMITIIHKLGLWRSPTVNNCAPRRSPGCAWWAKSNHNPGSKWVKDSNLGAGVLRGKLIPRRYYKDPPTPYDELLFSSWELEFKGELRRNDLRVVSLVQLLEQLNNKTKVLKARSLIAQLFKACF